MVSASLKQIINQLQTRAWRRVREPKPGRLCGTQPVKLCGPQQKGLVRAFQATLQGLQSLPRDLSSNACKAFQGPSKGLPRAFPKPCKAVQGPSNGFVTAGDV